MTRDADSYPLTRALRQRFDLRAPRVRAGAVIAVALLIGFVVWLLVRGGSSTPKTPPRASAVAITSSGLKTLARAVGRPIYWIGPRPGETYELTKTSDDRVFIRYLPRGVAVGTDQPYLTIGTYPVKNAYAVTTQLASRKGSVKVDAGKNGIAFYSKSSPTSVYLAYRGSSYQVEVYDPSASKAHETVSSHQVISIAPAGTRQGGGARAVSVQKLKAFAGSVKHPLYWAGTRTGVTYELTQTTSDSVYLRYLPSGVAVGTGKPYLTVGTYPVKNAFAVTRAQARKPGSVRVDAGGGAIAFYSKARPTNVYLAYPGDDFQVEVYDPSPGRARDLVASRKITRVG